MKTKLLTLMLSLVCFYVSAQTWTHYSVQNTSTQLCNDYVNTIAIEKNGTVWFGTNDGISKFDGTVWKTIIGDSIPLVVPEINIDAKGKKWLVNGPPSQGYLSEYNDTSWTFYSHYPSCGYYYESLTIDSLGNKWILTDCSVLKFNGTNWLKFNNIDSIKNTGVFDKYIIDKQGNKWTATSNGLVKSKGTTNVNYTTADGLIFNTVLSLAIDTRGDLWFGTDSGVSKYNGTTWTNYTTINGHPFKKVRSMGSDKNGNVWFGTYGYGALKFDGTSWTSYSANGLVSDYVNCIIEDKNQHLWIGTHPDYNKILYKGGVSEFDGTSWKQYSTSDGLASNSVNTILIDTQGYKWFGTSNGVSKFDGTTWKNYTTVDGLPDNWISSIAIDAQGNKWFGTSNGLSKFNGTTWKNFTITDGLPNNSVNSVSIDAKGNIWLATDSNAICKYDGSSFTTYYKSHKWDSSAVTAAIDIDGKVWCIRSSNGSQNKLYEYNGSTWTMYNSYDYHDIAIDAQGNKWIAGKGGILKYDGNTWIMDSLKMDLPTSYFWTISIDSHGNKWLSLAENGIIKYSDGGAGPFNVTPQTEVKEITSNELSLQISPNPTTSSFGLSSEGTSIVKIYTSNGILVKETKVSGKESVSVTDLSAGVYIVKIIKGNKETTRSLIVK